MAQIHILHSATTTQFAEAIARGLEREGYSTTWDAQHGAMKAMSGKSLERASSSACVGMWSRDIATAKWTLEAAGAALARNMLVELTLDPIGSPIEGSTLAPLDFANWGGETNSALWKAFMARIRQTVGHPTGARLPLKEEARPVFTIVAAAAAVVAGMAAGGFPASRIESNSLAGLGHEGLASNVNSGDAKESVGGPNFKVHEPASARAPASAAPARAHFERIEAPPPITIVKIEPFSVAGVTELASAAPAPSDDASDPLGDQPAKPAL